MSYLVNVSEQKQKKKGVCTSSMHGLQHKAFSLTLIKQT